jgi:hypothetical protein
MVVETLEVTRVSPLAQSHEKVESIHLNAVKAGLASHAQDWLAVVACPRTDEDLRKNYKGFNNGDPS